MVSDPKLKAIVNLLQKLIHNGLSSVISSIKVNREAMLLRQSYKVEDQSAPDEPYCISKYELAYLAPLLLAINFRKVEGGK